MTDHTAQAAHYAIQHDHANDLTELNRLREVNAGLQKDADRFQWLQERFAGYDFEWGEPTMVCAVFEVGQGFRGGRDIGAAIDAAIARAEK